MPAAPEGVCEAKPELRTSASVQIPIPSLPARPKEDTDEWNEQMSTLFEWVGMAGLGSQRLNANDRVDPYVSVYETPAPSVIGTIIHMKWTGLLHPAFVQSVLDAAVTSIQKGATATGAGTPSFVSITTHAWPTAPVAYIPSAKREPPREPPLRIPREDAEDSWCLLLASEQVQDSRTRGERLENATEEVRWALAESIGQWDSRWG